MKWLHGLIVLGVMVSAARGQEGEKGGAGESPKSNSATANEPTKDAKAEAAGSAEVASRAATPPPEWLKDMSWYYIDVPRFRNGERSNDPPGTLAWGAETKDLAPSYGGDLQGVREKLGYLESLGVNGLILANVLGTETDRHGFDMSIHVDPMVSVPSGGVDRDEDTNDKRTWTLTPGDQLLIDLMKEARRKGMRVVLQRIMTDRGEHDEVTADDLVRLRQPFRWLDTNNDGDPSDGVDGWVMRRTVMYQGSNHSLSNREIKECNPKAAYLALDSGGSDEQSESSGFDDVLYSHAGDAAVQFFTTGQKSYSLSDLMKRLQSKRIRDLHSQRIVYESLQNLVDPHLIFALVKESDWVHESHLNALRDQKSEFAAFLDRWRLYITLRYFSTDAPVVQFGDEVGFCFRSNEMRPAMWWNDLPNPESKSEFYRGDFYALIQMLNTFRARFAPLRRGDFKPIIADDEKKLLAFARTMPGDEVILVMNYGDTKQSVSLTVGQPGELVPVLSPQLKPMPMPRKGQPAPPEPELTKVPELRVGAQREFVKPNGSIDFWVDPMGVRIVLVGDSARGGKK